MQHHFYVKSVWIIVVNILLCLPWLLLGSKNVAQYLERWKALKKLHFDVEREDYLAKIIQKVKGIYVNPLKIAHTSEVVKETILMQVVEVMDISFEQSSFEEKYLPILLNNLCYLNQYQFKTLLFVVTNNMTIFQSIQNISHQINPYTEVVPYPYSLFWDFVSKKQTNITLGRGRADYEGYFPTFHHFGALPMIIPVYEILNYNVNIIYLDIDNAFVKDPIPEFTLEGRRYHALS